MPVKTPDIGIAATVSALFDDKIHDPVQTCPECQNLAMFYILKKNEKTPAVISLDLTWQILKYNNFQHFPLFRL